MSLDAPEEFAGNEVKREQLLTALLAGRTLRDAADQAGWDYRHAKRVAAMPDFKREKAERLAELQDADADGLLEFRRSALSIAKFALAKQASLLNDTTTPAGVVARVARDVEDLLVRLHPLALDLAVVHAEPEMAGPVRSLEEMFGIPEGFDQGDVMDFGRALMRQLTGTGPADAGEALARRHRQQEPEPAEAEEAPALADPPSTTQPMHDWLEAVAAQRQDPPAEPEPPAPVPDPKPPAPVLVMPTGPESAPR
jgi:hypothetical protein